MPAPILSPVRQGRMSKSLRSSRVRAAAKFMRYKHCLMLRGTTYQMAWIPEKFATVGKYVKLKDQDGWKIEQAYTSAPEDYVLSHRDDHMHTREFSDI